MCQNSFSSINKKNLFVQIFKGIIVLMFRPPSPISSPLPLLPPPPYLRPPKRGGQFGVGEGREEQGNGGGKGEKVG